MGYCINPKCPCSLIGSYVVWFAREGRDLYALLLETGVSTKVAKRMVLEGKGNDVAVEVIDARRAVLAMWEEGDQWTVWDLCMDQSFDDGSPAASARRATPPMRLGANGPRVGES